jgi:hypothetical protein
MSAAPDLDEFEVLQVRQDGIDTAAHERRALALLRRCWNACWRPPSRPCRRSSLRVVVAACAAAMSSAWRMSSPSSAGAGQPWSDALRPWVQDWLQQQARDTASMRAASTCA